MKHPVSLCAALLLAILPVKAAPLNDAALWRPRFVTPSIVALDNETDRELPPR